MKYFKKFKICSLFCQFFCHFLNWKSHESCIQFLARNFSHRFCEKKFLARNRAMYSLHFLSTVWQVRLFCFQVFFLQANWVGNRFIKDASFSTDSSGGVSKQLSFFGFLPKRKPFYIPTYIP